MKAQRPPNMTERLAAALIQAGLVEREAAKAMTAKEIVRLTECDHYPVPRALDGTNHPTNLHFRIKAEHREKTAKHDIPQIAKSKRLSKAHEEFRAMITRPDKGREEKEIKGRWKGKIPSRPFQKKNARLNRDKSAPTR